MTPPQLCDDPDARVFRVFTTANSGVCATCGLPICGHNAAEYAGVPHLISEPRSGHRRRTGNNPGGGNDVSNLLHSAVPSTWKASEGD